MARRRELKSIASGIAAHCVSRNNDISGHWAIGVIYNIAIQRGVDCVSIDIASAERLPRELSAFRRLFRQQFGEADHPLYRFITGFIVDFRFEPYAVSVSRGEQARATCTVHVVDDHGQRRSAIATTYCYPHNERLEQKSTRG